MHLKSLTHRLSYPSLQLHASLPQTIDVFKEKKKRKELG